MLTLKKAFRYAAILGVGITIGRCTYDAEITSDYLLVPRSSYCFQMEKPLSDFFQNNIERSMEPQEIYQMLQDNITYCGR
jgi:hypothetical protein